MSGDQLCSHMVPGSGDSPECESASTGLEAPLERCRSFSETPADQYSRIPTSLHKVNTFHYDQQHPENAHAHAFVKDHITLSFQQRLLSFVWYIIAFLFLLVLIATYRQEGCHFLDIHDALLDMDGRNLSNASEWSEKLQENVGAGQQRTIKDGTCNTTENQEHTVFSKQFWPWWCFILQFLQVYDCSGGDGVCTWAHHTPSHNKGDMCNRTERRCSPQMTWHLVREDVVSSVELRQWSPTPMDLNDTFVYVRQKALDKYLECNATWEPQRLVAYCPNVTSTAVFVTWSCGSCDFILPTISVISCSQYKGLWDSAIWLGVVGAVRKGIHLFDTAICPESPPGIGSYLRCVCYVACVLLLGCWISAANFQNESILMLEKPFLVVASLSGWSYGIGFFFHFRLSGLKDVVGQMLAELWPDLDNVAVLEKSYIRAFMRGVKGICAWLVCLLPLVLKDIGSNFLQQVWSHAAAILRSVVKYWSSSLFPVFNSFMVMCIGLLVSLLWVLVLLANISKICQRADWMLALTTDELLEHEWKRYGCILRRLMKHYPNKNAAIQELKEQLPGRDKEMTLDKKGLRELLAELSKQELPQNSEVLPQSPVSGASSSIVAPSQEPLQVSSDATAIIKEVAAFKDVIRMFVQNDLNVKRQQTDILSELVKEVSKLNSAAIASRSLLQRQATGATADEYRTAESSEPDPIRDWLHGVDSRTFSRNSTAHA
uniref:Uncharacterized protein n=1 Tax=Eutreptiella gymnastica TaxID=73025 RepID=A0A7S4LFD7_9EUGL